MSREKRSLTTYDVIVVGAGAAGLMAAGSAGESGANVLLLDKMPLIGTKLRLTGKGRCNLTNTADLPTFLTSFGPQGRFLRNAFARFYRKELLVLLRRYGVETIVERGGRVFPRSGRAGDVVSGLERYLAASGVTVCLNEPVTGLVIQDGKLEGVRLREGTRRARCLILATGGASYPGTGSTGDGYPWLKAVGHTIHPLRPALVPLVTVEDWPRRLTGLSLRHVRATLLLEGKPLESLFGEMLFTHFGISGPIILSLSARAVEALEKGKVQFAIDLKPALSDEQLNARLLRDLDQFGRQSLLTIAKGLVPGRLATTLLEIAGLRDDQPAHQVTGAQRHQLAGVLRDLRITIKEPRPFREAMVTAGGVELREIDPRTMESRLVPGLYLTGELLNLHADTGGYNLQAAFSTGYVAGKAAAERALSDR